MIKIAKFLILLFIAVVSMNFATNVALAGHQQGTEGYYCDGNVIWHDTLFYEGEPENHEPYKDCGSSAVCTEFEDPMYENGNAKCVAKNPSFNQCYWTFLRNECTSCGLARTVEENTCTRETRISAENVRDLGCNNSDWCSVQTTTSSQGNTVETTKVSPTIQSSDTTVQDSQDSSPFTGVNFQNISCGGNYLTSGDLASSIASYSQVTGKPVWITEVGYNTDNQLWQGEYLKRISAVAARMGVPVLSIYAWNDSLRGGPDEKSFGLYTINNQIKTSGEVFSELSRL